MTEIILNSQLSSRSEYSFLLKLRGTSPPLWGMRSADRVPPVHEGINEDVENLAKLWGLENCCLLVKLYNNITLEGNLFKLLDVV